jgi:hypothetical protein
MNTSAETGGDGLVRAFSAKPQIESLAEDGFSGLWKTVRKRCEIDVGAANYRNSRATGHSYSRTLATAECILAGLIVSI